MLLSILLRKVALHNYKSDKLQIGCRNKWDCLYDIISSAYSIKGKIFFCGYAERYPAEQWTNSIFLSIVFLRVVKPVAIFYEKARIDSFLLHRNWSSCRKRQLVLDFCQTSCHIVTYYDTKVYSFVFRISYSLSWKLFIWT